MTMGVVHLKLWSKKLFENMGSAETCPIKPETKLDNSDVRAMQVSAMADIVSKFFPILSPQSRELSESMIDALADLGWRLEPIEGDE